MGQHVPSALQHWHLLRTKTLPGPIDTCESVEGDGGRASAIGRCCWYQASDVRQPKCVLRDPLPVPVIITVGIEEFATGSEGEEIANIRWEYISERRS